MDSLLLQLLDSLCSTGRKIKVLKEKKFIVDSTILKAAGSVESSNIVICSNKFFLRKKRPANSTRNFSGHLNLLAVNSLIV